MQIRISTTHRDTDKSPGKRTRLPGKRGKTMGSLTLCPVFLTVGPWIPGGLTACLCTAPPVPTS